MNVRLKYATAQSFAVSGMSFSYVYAHVKVRNLAFDKDVALRYRHYDGSFRDAPLTFVASFGSYDVFGAGNLPFTSEFAVRYSVLGATYWDNNGGSNYHVPTEVAIAGGHVALHRATVHIGAQSGGGFVFTTSRMSGEIYVDNLSFAKSVGIRYSGDNWHTVHDAPAVYAGTVEEGKYVTGLGIVERWSFTTPELNESALGTPFRFAVYYRNLATGEWHWDNNFGLDYSVQKVTGATLG